MHVLDNVVSFIFFSFVLYFIYLFIHFGEWDHTIKQGSSYRNEDETINICYDMIIYLRNLTFVQLLRLPYRTSIHTRVVPEDRRRLS